MKNNQPFLLWLLCLIFIGLAFYALLQIIQTIANWNVLLAIQYQPGPLYPLFQGTFLFLGFVTAAVLLWMRLAWAPLFDSIFLALAAVWYWLDRLVFSTNPRPIGNSVFALVLFLILFILLIASLWALKPFMHSDSPDKEEEENES